MTDAEALFIWTGVCWDVLQLLSTLKLNIININKEIITTIIIYYN